MDEAKSDGNIGGNWRHKIKQRFNNRRCCEGINMVKECLPVLQFKIVL
ncbi:MAG: hypothetical protein LAKADJCE_00719 [Candidatus Argoarchaeum ethanivorans]|uniref:Uncharacterized protein n=1 Tax=Candidatus Argoarchaeum ethanivorans TaxID=2608793 RepID=A0A811TET1_9EURY|nr:MAG: hypothetical protein LAKADJCE_00719 [Candidatus Argoarchaeum ethanivorans]